MSAVASVALEEIMAPRLGSVDPAKHPDETFELYSIPAFDTGQPEVLRGSAIGSAKQTVEPGDVLLSRIVPHIRRTWVVGQLQGRRQIASGEWIVFRGKQMDPRYLRHVLVGDPFHVQFMQTVAGVGGSLLRARPAYVAKIVVPFPRPADQRRIAEILDKADSLRAKRRAALAQLDTLSQSMFLDMFGDSTTNAKKWRNAKLGELVAEFRYGSSNKSADHGKPALRIPNVVGGTIDVTKLKLVPVDAAEFERLRLQDGDLLIVRTNGNPDFVGRCAMFDSIAAATSGFDGTTFIFASYLIRARLMVDIVTPMFLREYLLGEEGRLQLRARSKTSAGQFNINTESLAAMVVPLPPIELQREFTARVKVVEEARMLQKNAITELDNLFTSLQHRAFQGEL